MVIEERLRGLGIELPPVPVPVATYVPVRIVGDLAFVAGQIAIDDGVVRHPGKLGAEVRVADGQDAARRCGLQALSALRGALGSLDRVAGIVQLTVFIASAPGFTDHPKVANGASDLFVEVFGEDGKHARAAVGVAELPLGGSVEVAVIAQVASS